MTFTYTVEDDTGLISNIAQVTVSVTGVGGQTAPVANPDTGSVDAGLTTAIDILNNDSATLPASLDPASISIVTGPTSGSVALNAGQALYTAAASTQDSTVTFTYTVNDSNGLTSNIAQVTVSVTGVGGGGGGGGGGQDPIAADDFSNVDAGSAVTINVLGNDQPGTGASIDASTVEFTSAPASGSAVVSTAGIVAV